VRFSVARPRWFGIPQNLTRFYTVDFEELTENYILTLFGRPFQILKLPIVQSRAGSVERREISFALELPTQLETRQPAGHDRIVYPYKEGVPFYLIYSKSSTFSLNRNDLGDAGTDFSMVMVVPPYDFSDAENSVQIDNLSNGLGLLIAYGKRSGWRLGWSGGQLISRLFDENEGSFTGIQLNPDTDFPHGSAGFAFTYIPVPLTLNEVEGRTYQVVIVMFRDKTLFFVPNAANYNETVISIRGYNAFTVYTRRYPSLSSSGFTNWNICVETPDGLKWVDRVSDITFRPLIVRKFYFLDKPVYLRDTSIVPTEATGILSAEFDLFSIRLNSWDYIPLGHYIIVELPNGKKLVYRVTSVRKQVTPDGTTYDIEGVSPIEDELCCLPLSFSPHLLTVRRFIEIGKAASHFPREIYLPEDIQDIMIVDLKENRERFKTLFDYFRYAFTYIAFNHYRQFAIDVDNDFNIVFNEVTNEWVDPPTNPIVSFEEVRDGLSPSVVVFGWNLVKNDALIEERGVVISSNESKPVEKRVEVTYSGFVYLPVGTNVTGYGTVKNIEWSVRPFDIKTKVVFVKYV